MKDNILEELKKKEVSPLVEKILTEGRRLVKMSRSKMASRYRDWDLQDQVYRGERSPDLEDLKQEYAGKPEKMIVPHTYAQVMTFVSFLFLMYNQNQRFYELVATGAEDYGEKKEDCELLLERDLRTNEWNTKLFQHLLDIARFGTGILETTWREDSVRAFVTPIAPPQDFNGMPVEAAPQPGQWQEFLKFQGNGIRNVSPYRFFPDTRHPLVDFQKGEFVAGEEEFSIGALRDLEARGEIAGVDFIEKLARNWDKDRGGSTRSDLAMDVNAVKGFDSRKDSSVVIVTKLQWWIVPNKFKIGNGEKDVLGPEDHRILYHVWYANDNRVIKFEEARNWHNEFSFTVAQFTPDIHHTIPMGLADLIYRLQDVISWLINSHITSVRRVIANRLVVNPANIDTKTLDGEGDIYMKKGVNLPLDRAVFQLRVQDVTGSHMADQDLLSKVMQVVTGVSDSMQGQYSQGRRDATQSRQVLAGAASRMKMHGGLIWESSLGRQARHMLTNHRQNLDIEQFAFALGLNLKDPAQKPIIDERFAKFKADPETVICSGDYFIFDSTQASEKGFMAQSLQDLLTAIMSSNPAAAMQVMSAINPAKVMEEIFLLRGVGTPERFAYSPEERQQMAMMQQAQLQSQAPAQSVQ